MVQQAKANGARRQASCAVLEVSLRTVERWEKAPDQGDQRRGPATGVRTRLAQKRNKPSSRYQVALSIAIYRRGRSWLGWLTPGIPGIGEQFLPGVKTKRSAIAPPQQ